MNSTLKSLIKKTPPMKWLLWRINKLEKAQKEEARKREECIKQLQEQNRELRREMEYLYYKGLHPDQYAENLKEWYKEKTGKTLDLEHPKTYNEKLQWMKLYDSTPIKTRLADKYLVREWVAERIGKEYLVPLLGVYEKFDDIDFDKLPDKFVIKTNHACGTNRIVTDKSNFDIQEARNFFNKKMNMNFAFRYGLQLHYKDIVPKIIIEKCLGGELAEYRFLCFNGEVKFIYVNEADPNPANYKRTLFTPDWRRMDVTIGHTAANYEIPKPKTLEKMLELATKLSQGFPHVRVDFYNVNEKIYFGEMTFTFSSGTQTVVPEEFGLEMGNWIKLPEKTKI